MDINPKITPKITSKNIIVTSARMNPPTPGHLKLINELLELSKNDPDSEIYVALSKTTGEKDPLECMSENSYIVKKKVLEEMIEKLPYKKEVNIRCTTDEERSPFVTILKIIDEKKNENPDKKIELYMVLGDDRGSTIELIKKQLYKNYTKEEIEIKSHILERTEMTKYAEMDREEMKKIEISKLDPSVLSASFVRKLVKYDLYDKFKDLYNPYLSENTIKSLYDGIEEGMKKPLNRNPILLKKITRLKNNHVREKDHQTVRHRHHYQLDHIKEQFSVVNTDVHYEKNNNINAIKCENVYTIFIIIHYIMINENQVNEENINNPNEIEIRLLSQGTFGCVYKPEIKCDTGEPGDVHYISKIQKNDDTLINEMIISSKIQQIPNYSSYFASIINKCPVSISSIKQSEIEKCKIFNKNTEESQYQESNNRIPQSEYISTRIRYAGNKNIDEYLRTLPEKSSLLNRKICTSYIYILKSLQKLLSMKIIHNDIKEKNIMYDELNHSPIIIDFGLSYVYSRIKNDKLIEDEISKCKEGDDPCHYLRLFKESSVFYTEEFYIYWCIDIYIISYIVQKVRTYDDSKKGSQDENIIIEKNVTENVINEIINNYINDFYKSIKNNPLFLDDNDKEVMRTIYTNYLKNFIGQSWENVFIDLFKPEKFLTWDLYSTAISFLFIVNSVKINEDEKINKYIKTWKSIILSSPNERKTIEQILNELTGK
jgi:serine/threonine protein kinase/nicotinic acid mononucleotide adenylyltransferase